MNKELKYIPSLDGLRAVAVMFVLIFHIKPDFLPGGFIGVDVFFVLSGFLISTILIERKKTKDFYISFILGRARRLVPIYLIVCVLTTCVAYAILIPAELHAFSKSLVSSLALASNIYFFTESGYFSDSTEFFPLLHTWSLATEWQFYLLFPLLFVTALANSKHRLKFTLFLVSVFSILITVYVTNINASMAFYLSPFRVFEFTIGGLLYFCSRKVYSLINVTVLYILLFIAVAILIILAFVFNKSTLYPSHNALYVCLLTAISIWSAIQLESRQRKTGLDTNIAVFIGKISYSLYLWHWPVIVFVKLWSGYSLEPLHYIFIITVTIVLSIFSFYFIEKKFRSREYENTKWIYIVSTIFLLFSMTFYMGSKASNGYSFRMPSTSIAKHLVKWEKLQGRCEATQAIHNYYKCVIGNPEVSPSILILGDSHMQVLTYGLDKWLTDNNKSAALLTKGGCPPIFAGVAYNSISDKQLCLDLQSAIIKYLESFEAIDTVILAGRWPFYENKPLHGQNNEVGITSNMVFIDRLQLTLDLLSIKARRVFILDSLPEHNVPALEYVLRSELMGKRYNETFALKSHSIKQKLSLTHNVKILSQAPNVCKEKVCYLVLEENLVYFDENHLTRFGAQLVLEQSVFPVLTK